MRNTLFLISEIILFSFTNSSLFAQAVNSHQEFWSHYLKVDYNISYEEDPRQKLDIYTQGSWISIEEKIPEISKKYSTLYYVTSNSPAILTVHGSDDNVVPHSQALLLHEALQKAGAKNKWLTLQGGKHMGFNEEQFQFIYQTIFSFLDEVME